LGTKQAGGKKTGIGTGLGGEATGGGGEKIQKKKRRRNTLADNVAV